MRAALILALLAGPGLLALAARADGGAACPVAADLARGIRVTYDDGLRETYRAGAPALVEVEGRDAAGGAYRLALARGAHILAYEAGGAGATYYYGRPHADLPVPEPLGAFEAGVTVTDAGGERFEPQSQAYGPLERVEIGGCRFDAIAVSVAYRPGVRAAPSATEGLTWLPALGIALFAWREAPGAPRDAATPVAIEAAT